MIAMSHLTHMLCSLGHRHSHVHNLRSMSSTAKSLMHANPSAQSLPCCAAVGIAPELRASQFLVVVNTVISLLGSCIAVFMTSSYIHDRFDIFHVQNATLAGGVAMGAAANLFMTPGGAPLAASRHTRPFGRWA